MVSIKNENSDISKHLSRSKVIVISLTSGAIAGALAKTTIAPLDRTKINFQIKQDSYSAKKAIRFIGNVYRTEGFFALWRGNSATMARIMPYAAIQFAAHEQWKHILDTYNTNHQTANRFWSGALAGMTSQTLTYPLDLARARMAVTKKYEYASLREVFVKIFNEEGSRSFYRGFIPTIIGVIPYAGISFFTYDTLKKIYFDKHGTTHLSGVTALFFGAIAGILGQTSSYPLDIVRRRMQTTRVDHMVMEYMTIFGTIKKIYRDEGIKRGFFKGLSMNWIKGPIAVGISYSTYDIIKESIRKFVIYFDEIID